MAVSHGCLLPKQVGDGVIRPPPYFKFFEKIDRKLPSKSKTPKTY